MNSAFKHVAVSCTNMEASLRFYTEAFGLKILEKYAENRSNEKLDKLLGLTNVHSRAILLGNDSLCIELIEFSSPTSISSPAPNRIGFSHIALQVDDIQAEYAR